MEQISALAACWLREGGLPKVELAAMEPTLWHDGEYSFLDIASLLAERGFKVNLTTNGSTLARYADMLAQRPISKLRISWHSLEPALYEKMTGGDYGIFLEGIRRCEQLGLPLCYNRVLFKGYGRDILRHLEIVDRQRSRIKFMELYNTAQGSPFFDKYHMTMAEFLDIVEASPLLERDDVFKPEYAARARHVWRTPNGGRVEFKIAETCSKPPACGGCQFRDSCIEGFAEYFRVTPDGNAAFCYLRGDFDVRLFQNDEPDFSAAEKLLRNTGINFKKWIKQRSLRLVLTSKCNYNCVFPGGETVFCLGKRFRML